KARMMSLHGISRDAWKRYLPQNSPFVKGGQGGFQHWELFYPGFKYNMFDIQAAIGIHQLKRIDGFLEKRKRYVSMYNEAFKSIPEIVTLKTKGRIKHAHHLYVIIVKTEELKADRDQLMNEIQKNGIGVGVHFRALHLQPYYQEGSRVKGQGSRKNLPPAPCPMPPFKRGMFPVAEYVSDRVISLPLYPKMRVSDVKYVIKVVKDIIIRSRK
ncbi:MAG: DegT/DnrJ/EryC1/StrS aminotransferase family protein, partial [Nitrospinae bacterium]|nr:DegT/DnrJ/EryC1/StrS aminotransferase family protein [Nitrospinota bacterium]